MAEFKIYQDGEEWRGCDCCGFPTKLIEYDGVRGMDPVLLCEVCYRTHLAKALLYPDQCKDSDLYRSVAIIANMLLEAIKEREGTRP